MSFLSIEQRQAALNQLEVYIALLNEDAMSLVNKMAEIQSTRDLMASAAARIRKACEGELSADELIPIDQVCGERLRSGMRHFPVKITHEAEVLVTGRWP